MGSWTDLKFIVHEKLLRKHELVSSYTRDAGKGQTIGRPRADPVFDLGRIGKTMGRPRADGVVPGQIG